MSSTQFYLRSISKYKPLSREEETLLARNLKAGDEAAFQKLWLHNLLFTVSVANGVHVALEVEDKYQLASLGLRKAIRKFDPASGNKLITYAEKFIRGEIIDGVEDSRKLVSIDTLNWRDDGTGGEGAIDLLTISEDNQSEDFDDLTMEDIVSMITADLKTRDAEILKMYFGIGCPEKKRIGDLASQFDISEESVFRIIRDAKKSIRRKYRHHVDWFKNALDRPKYRC